jgi:hypothetical protein
MQDIWNARHEIAGAYFRDTKEFRDNSRLKVPLPDGMGTAVCVLRSYGNEYGDVVVTTLWQDGETPDDGVAQ